MPEFEKVAFELEASTTGSPKWGEAKTSEGRALVALGLGLEWSIVFADSDQLARLPHHHG